MRNPHDPLDIGDHTVESCFNAGWTDDPAWQIVCACTWECWEQKTEAAAVQLHEQHEAAARAWETTHKALT